MSALNILMRRLRTLVDRTALMRVAYRGAVRVLQISSRDAIAVDSIEHIEPAGFSSHPLAGAEAVVINAGGNSGRGIVIVVNDRRYRMVIEEGESIIYNMPHGDFVKIKKDRSIHVKSAAKVFVESPLTEISGNLLVHGNVQIDGTTHGNGKITSDDDVMAGSISLKTHRTSGVTGGPSISGVPVV